MSYRTYAGRIACATAALCAGFMALAAASAQAQTRDYYCGGRPAQGFDQPPNQAHSGAYLNKIYGYSLTIPAGLTAFTGSNGPERGFVIGLSAMPRAFLSVDASYDVFYDITAQGVHRRDLNAIRLNDTVLLDQSVPAALAQAPGGRYLMRVQCRGEMPTLHAQVIVVRNREIYRLDLQTTPERYPKDLRQFEALLKSWRWEPLR
jgi:hypothetical protein